MSGFELAGEARRLRPDFPVLLTSVYAEKAVVQDGRLGRARTSFRNHRRQDIAAKVRAALDRRSAT